jgi:hypothetical protein
MNDASQGKQGPYSRAFGSLEKNPIPHERCWDIPPARIAESVEPRRQPMLPNKPNSQNETLRLSPHPPELDRPVELCSNRAGSKAAEQTQFPKRNTPALPRRRNPTDLSNRSDRAGCQTCRTNPISKTKRTRGLPAAPNSTDLSNVSNRARSQNCQRNPIPETKRSPRGTRHPTPAHTPASRWKPRSTPKSLFKIATNCSFEMLIDVFPSFAPPSSGYSK